MFPDFQIKTVKMPTGRTNVRVVYRVSQKVQVATSNTELKAIVDLAFSRKF